MYQPCDNEPSIPMPNSSNCSVEELNARFAVRFFLKKSKRFDLLKQQKKYRLQQLSAKKPMESLPECLFYLGLSPSRKGCDLGKRRRETPDDFNFPKPIIYECAYCIKIFFHKLVYRRHMIEHMKKGHRCTKCNLGFDNRISRRRHELFCYTRSIIKGRSLKML